MGCRATVFLPDLLNCNGWDIRKALYLFTRTNGALLEWLNSPIKYIENGEFASHLREMAPKAMNHTALCYHYSHMARQNAREYLFKDQVRLKKYFYVLRPLLALRYIESFNCPPPVEFERLLEAVAPSTILGSARNLLELKRNSTELGLGAPIPEVNSYIEGELDSHASAFSGQGRPDLHSRSELIDQLNKIFREAICG